MNQSEFLAITCDKVREKLLARSAIGFGFSSYWLKNWHEILQPITMRRNHNHVITFDSNLNLDTRVFEYLYFSYKMYIFYFSFNSFLTVDRLG